MYDPIDSDTETKGNSEMDAEIDHYFKEMQLSQWALIFRSISRMV